MTADQIYEKVLAQLLDAGVPYPEAERIARASADDIEKMEKAA